MDLSNLPDYFALEHLSRSLWRDGESRGAALLVGSGFSRFAKLKHDPLPEVRYALSEPSDANAE
jgi:hypothetical protein